MKILVTGAAGFIGFHVSKKLIQNGYDVVGLDNINDYYDQELKFSRLKHLGISKNKAKIFNQISRSGQFKFIRIDLEDKDEMTKLFKFEKFDLVCNLAAQAGVRYSLEHPHTYIKSNINGFLNILECCRSNKIKRLVYASSSSVYGSNKKIPFSETDKVDNPLSLYAVTKKSNELMAHSYTSLFGFETIGLRFFTVYGPWGRPDMALFLFTKAILNKQPINVFNYGNHSRDFTYIDDIVDGVIMTLVQDSKDKNLHKVYNIGNGNPVNLMSFISALETKLKLKAKKNLLPMQPGDVEETFASTKKLSSDYNYAPEFSVDEGVNRFLEWYKNYYKIN